MYLARASERVNDLSHYENRRKVIGTIKRNKWWEMHTGMLASERFISREGSEVINKCEEGSLMNITMSARGPLTDVICGHQRIMSGRAGRNEEAELEGKRESPVHLHVLGVTRR